MVKSARSLAQPSEPPSIRPPRARRVAEPSATLCGTARAPATARVLLSARLFCALLCLVTTDGLLDAGMRRSRWTRSSLLVPALLIELAAETGTILRGMNAVMCHDEVYVAAAATARAHERHAAGHQLV